MICFDAPLQPQALDDVKFIIQRNVHTGVMPDGITLEGVYCVCVCLHGHMFVLVSVCVFVRK